MVRHLPPPGTRRAHPALSTRRSPRPSSDELTAVQPPQKRALATSQVRKPSSPPSRRSNCASRQASSWSRSVRSYAVAGCRVALTSLRAVDAASYRFSLVCTTVSHRYRDTVTINSQLPSFPFPSNQTGSPSGVRSPRTRMLSAVSAWRRRFQCETRTPSPRLRHCQGRHPPRWRRPGDQAGAVVRIAVHHLRNLDTLA